MFITSAGFCVFYVCEMGQNYFYVKGIYHLLVVILVKERHQPLLVLVVLQQVEHRHCLCHLLHGKHLFVLESLMKNCIQTCQKMKTYQYFVCFLKGSRPARYVFAFCFVFFKGNIICVVTYSVLQYQAYPFSCYFINFRFPLFCITCCMLICEV